MSLKMTTIQRFLLSAQFVDKKNNPAEVENIKWLTSNSDVLALEPSEDGKSCMVSAVGIPGTPEVQVSADADTSEGVELLVGRFAVEVVAAKATSITLTPGPVEDIPDEPAPPATPPAPPAEPPPL